MPHKDCTSIILQYAPIHNAKRQTTKPLSWGGGGGGGGFDDYPVQIIPNHTGPTIWGSSNADLA